MKRPPMSSSAIGHLNSIPSVPVLRAIVVRIGRIWASRGGSPEEELIDDPNRIPNVDLRIIVGIPTHELRLRNDADRDRRAANTWGFGGALDGDSGLDWLA